MSGATESARLLVLLRVRLPRLLLILLLLLHLLPLLTLLPHVLTKAGDGGVRAARHPGLELGYELELKVQHAARGTADLIASRIPPGQGWFRKGGDRIGSGVDCLMECSKWQVGSATISTIE